MSLCGTDDTSGTLPSRPPRERSVLDPFETAAKIAAGAERGGGRTGGLYMPPYKLVQMMANTADMQSKEYQRMTWEALKKAINGLINKVNVSNIKSIVVDILGENMP